MLRQAKEERTLKENLMLASSTAFVSGVTNVAGVLAFLAFTANISGHVANLARHIIERNFHEVSIFFIWLLVFFFGAFASNFIIRSMRGKSKYRAHAVPIVIEIIIMLLVAIYGHQFYQETQAEREVVIGAMIFAMGLQNSLVSNISGGVIKTTHLTGLFTDLGSEVAEWFHPESRKNEAVRNKIYIRLTILAFYLFGGLAGGFFFNRFDFLIFYFIPVVLLSILYYDVSPIALHKLARFVSRGAKTGQNKFKN